MSWSDSARAPTPTREPDASRSCFHGRGEEMVKGAAMETVLLLRRCPPALAENYAVAVRDMNAALLEKQELLARAEQAPLELPPPLPQPNARDFPGFPNSRKRKMTAYEAALQEEVDAEVRRRKEVAQAQDDADFRQRWHEQSVKDIIARHSQQESPPLPRSNPPPPSYQPPPSPPLPSPNNTSSTKASSSSSDSKSSDDDSDNAGESAENLRPKRGVRRSRKLAENSQTRKEVAASRAPKRRKPGKKALAAAAEMSQLLDGYVPPPSSAVLLNK